MRPGQRAAEEAGVVQGGDALAEEGEEASLDGAVEAAQLAAAGAVVDL